MNTLSLRKIREKMYIDQRLTFEAVGEDLDDYRKYPYSAVKARIYIEVAAVLVSVLQYTKIQPNHITISYALLGPISIFLVFLDNDISYFIALLCFVFLKAFLDWSDGALARIRDNCTSLGAILDSWGAIVNSYSFQICIGLYVFNNTGNLVFLCLIIVVLFLRAIDLKKFKTQFLGQTVIEGVVEKGESKNKRVDTTSIPRNSRLYIAFLLCTKVLDDRARVVDTILFLILFERIFLEQFIVAQGVYLLMVVGVFVRFAAGFYVVYFNKEIVRQ